MKDCNFAGFVVHLLDKFFVILQDEHLINHVVKNNLLKPIVDAFVANGNRYNLLNSAVLELFEYIRKVPIFSKLICFSQSYFRYVKVFTHL